MNFARSSSMTKTLVSALLMAESEPFSAKCGGTSSESSHKLQPMRVLDTKIIKNDTNQLINEIKNELQISWQHPSMKKTCHLLHVFCDNTQFGDQTDLS